MIWFVFALLAALTTAAYRITTRHLMKAHSPYAYALLINLFGAFFTIPLIWTDFSVQQMPTNWWPWLLVILSTALWCTIMILVFTTFKHLPVTRREQISQIEVVFVLLLSVVFLSEQITLWKTIGIALVLAGTVIASIGRTSIYSGWRSKWVGYTVLAAALYALVTIVDKAALQYFPTGVYTFMLYFFPAVVIIGIIWKKNKWSETALLLEKKRYIVLIATLLSVSSYYLGLRAYDIADASQVYTVLKTSTIFAVVGGLIFFREERIHIARKIISAVLVVAGAILVSGIVI